MLGSSVNIFEILVGLVTWVSTYRVSGYLITGIKTYVSV